MRPEIAKIYNGQCDEVGKERETGLRGASGVSVSTNSQDMLHKREKGRRGDDGRGGREGGGRPNVFLI